MKIAYIVCMCLTNLALLYIMAFGLSSEMTVLATFLLVMNSMSFSTRINSWGDTGVSDWRE
jgi:hypothetical protein